MKIQVLTIIGLLMITGIAKAQKVDSMYVHLYTDSLKKGTYNYINVDGLMNNGRWLPLDSNYVEFKCSDGKFIGNELWLDHAYAGEKVRITTTLKTDRAQTRSFEMYVKKKPDDDQLPSEQDIIQSKKKNKNKNKD